MKRHDKFFVYILEDKNGIFYTGYTNNLEARIKRHNNGHGAKFLRGKGPIKLVYAKEYKYYLTVLKEERRIKTLGRKEKEKMVIKWKAATLP